MASFGVVLDRKQLFSVYEPLHKVPRGGIAERNSSSYLENPFHNLLHSHQLDNSSKSKLPTFWDMDRSDSAGKGSFGPEIEEKWGVMHLKCIHELCTIIVILQSYLHHIRVILLLFNDF